MSGVAQLLCDDCNGFCTVETLFDKRSIRPKESGERVYPESEHRWMKDLVSLAQVSLASFGVMLVLRDHGSIACLWLAGRENTCDNKPGQPLGWIDESARRVLPPQRMSLERHVTSCVWVCANLCSNAPGCTNSFGCVEFRVSWVSWCGS